MDQIELARLKEQLAVLKEVACDYPGRNIITIIDNIESRIKHAEKQNK